MSQTVDVLILDLLEWLDSGPRPYSVVMEAWRTSCPTLPVWEDANARGFIVRQRAPGSEPMVSVSETGARYLRARRRGAR